MLKMLGSICRRFSTATLIGACIAATAIAMAVPASAQPNPFNPAECEANADAVCNIGPYGPGSVTNPANPASPLNPMNPANPASPMNPMNPANPASPMNPMNPATPMSPMNPANPASPMNP